MRYSQSTPTSWSWRQELDAFRILLSEDRGFVSNASQSLGLYPLEISLLGALSIDHYNSGRRKYIQYSLRPLTRIRSDIDDHRRGRPQSRYLKESSAHPVSKHVEQKRTPKIGPGVNLVRVKLLLGR